MDLSPADVETDLIDLSGVPFAALPDCAGPTFDASIERMLEQVDRPRANIGGSGPPGRVD